MMEEEIAKIVESGKVPKLLLHSCCAPCSTHVIDLLAPYFSITILYYNPNIEPLEEYEKRKKEEIRFLNQYHSKNPLYFLDCDHENEVFHEIVKGLEKEKEGGARCIKCYYLRLEKTACEAKKNGFDYFATTLTVSPLKNSSKLNEIGNHLSEVYQIPYLYSDFKKKEGYKHSIELAKKYDLYRQDYCGCIYSKEMREEDKRKKALE